MAEREARRAQALALYGAGLELLSKEKWESAVTVFEQALEIAHEQDRGKISNSLELARVARDTQRKLRAQRLKQEQDARLAAEMKDRVSRLAESLRATGVPSRISGEFMSDDPGRTETKLMSADPPGQPGARTVERLGESPEFKLHKRYLPVEDLRGETVGVASIASGGVYRKTYAGWLPLPAGERVCYGDELATDARGRLHLYLADGTAFTLLSNAQMKIDEFVYDPATALEERVFSMFKGACRFITGKVGSKDPARMRFRLPSGVCGGIRGTEFIIELDADDTALVSLVEGEIVLVNPDGKKLLDMKPGQRVGVYRDGKVEPIANATAEQMDLLWRCLDGPGEERPAPLWGRPATWGIVLAVLAVLFGGIAVRRRIRAGRTS